MDPNDILGALAGPIAANQGSADLQGMLGNIMSNMGTQMSIPQASTDLDYLAQAYGLSSQQLGLQVQNQAGQNQYIQDQINENNALYGIKQQQEQYAQAVLSENERYAGQQAGFQQQQLAIQQANAQRQLQSQGTASGALNTPGQQFQQSQQNKQFALQGTEIPASLWHQDVLFNNQQANLGAADQIAAIQNYMGLIGLNQQQQEGLRAATSLGLEGQQMGATYNYNKQTQANQNFQNLLNAGLSASGSAFGNAQQAGQAGGSLGLAGAHP